MNAKQLMEFLTNQGIIFSVQDVDGLGEDIVIAIYKGNEFMLPFATSIDVYHEETYLISFDAIENIDFEEINKEFQGNY